MASGPKVLPQFAHLGMGGAPAAPAVVVNTVQPAAAPAKGKGLLLVALVGGGVAAYFVGRKLLAHHASVPAIAR